MTRKEAIDSTYAKITVETHSATAADQIQNLRLYREVEESDMAPKIAMSGSVFYKRLCEEAGRGEV